jgi:hypothetical protein
MAPGTCADNVVCLTASTSAAKLMAPVSAALLTTTVFGGILSAANRLPCKDKAAKAAAAIREMRVISCLML